MPRVANKGPDSLSHHSVTLAEDADDLEASVHASVMPPFTHSLDDINPFNAIIWERVKEATRSDPTLQPRTPLYPHVSASFPPYKRELPSEIPPYWDVYHNLSCIGEALVYGSWIMAPNSLCSEVLNTLHSAHQGITSLKAHTQTSVYWHGMSTGIINCCQQCSLCGAIIIILPASITCLPTTNTRILVVDDYIHLAGQHFLVWYADPHNG